MPPDEALPRFRVQPGELESSRIGLGADEARHVRVMRLRAGDRVRLFDGAGREVRAELVEVGDQVVARVEQELEPLAESPCRCVLAQAVPVKIPRFDDVVRLATELGVHRVLPVLSGHGELPGGGLEAVRRRTERWRRIAAAAAKQCRRSVVPEVTSPVAFDAIDWERLPEPRLMLHPGEGAEGDSVGAALSGERRPAVTLLVGPEGGWTPEELTAGRDRGCRVVGLGPRILRADSAGPAILAVVQHLWGDLA